ncbi:adhesion G protein-coupled receptor F5 isoform X1 [Monodelphis domestica]|uniref:Adhesion G protein-coupled receptor F5 n=1 Tax=Monodelphis domestica TaxID=13616 RepID=A0A5F8G938_MONDO|nr:adhesion G protein-coupled receptor F5 isoform X1 [Monodelphis domestica]XP_007484093.1 adhesion G protein-coupled receptor F5 isoform X1 [Monodelphis domestica]XP_007484094.1 adhesion G protein-coupled receptor F5 isoform X1 [Monodelphis domestica]XP_007484095.1 adhesion G protein-coupled receptor F5 isoform X1 [Monodelphis domestica]XP_007484096.1 adhesion G protein-coupled receptor F5 isoform X1 [Monodelphis domestica]XP_016286604.1 adhesion G protein-coupled receptor F5 isoform X1 [Mono
MNSPRRPVFCFLFLIVIYSSQAALNLSLESIVHSLINRSHELDSNDYRAESLRHKRAVATSSPAPEEYEIEIEISFENTSLLESFKAYYKNLSFPIQVINTNLSTDILSMEITTVCRSSGNEMLCSCESGYKWLPEVCLSNLTCQNYQHSAPEDCNCLKELPARGPYCQQVILKDITLRMSVKLSMDFQDDLRNSSSALYRSYKTDLERAFRQGYRILPGFKSVVITGFSPGSIDVAYNVKTSKPTPAQMNEANEQVKRLINSTYKMDHLSFEASLDNETKFSIVPEIIYEGDTVMMKCENEVQSTNVTWRHVERSTDIQNSSEFSIYTYLNHQVSVSILTIHNISLIDAGEYLCSLTYDIFYYEGRKKVNVISTEFVASEDLKVMCDNNPVSLSCCSGKDFNLSNIEWNQEGLINIPGISSIDSGCSKLTIKADGTQCLSGSAGTEVFYICSFLSGYGANSSKKIKVTFTSVANITVTADLIAISEGQNFSIKCISDVSSYDSVFWNTSAGTRINPKFYVTTTCNDRAESVLTVNTATREWNGTYHCIFRYKNSFSIATKDVTVYPLPLKHDILLDPLEADVPCGGFCHLRCCINEAGDYRVTFQIDGLSFPAVKKAQGNRVCYGYSLNTTIWCSKTVQPFCNFVNSVGESVQSTTMTLYLVPEENITCQDSNIGNGKAGKMIQKLCQFSDIPNNSGHGVGGTITYICEGSTWKVKKNDCIAAPINNLLGLTKALLMSPEQEEKLLTYLQDLSSSTEKVENEIKSSPGNLKAIITILELLSTVPTQVTSDMMKHVLSTVNVILGKPILNTWQILHQQQANESSRLLDSIERFSRVLHEGISAIPSITQVNVQMRGLVTTAGQVTDYDQHFVFPNSNLWGHVIIDRHQIESLQPNSSIVTLAYPTLKAILPQGTLDKNIVNGLVMTTTVSQGVTKPFRISMKFKKNDLSLVAPQCVFWNFHISNHTGGWDNTGCFVDQVKEESVLCTCNHLTSFSILMSPDSPDSNSLVQILLDIISYIGLGFSILSLAACLIIEAFVWKSVTKNRTSYMRHVCIVNIAASLLIADSWFIVSAVIHDQRYLLSETACVASTFFIHFFYLSVFFWMLTLGLMLFYRLVFILHDTSKSIQKAIAFSLGYGCPLVISIITVGVTQPRNVYMRKNACWLNWDDTKALLAFVIPALIIVVINVTITFVVITKILRPSIGDKPSIQEKNSLFQITKSIGVLTPLLGLTWGFGLATVFQESSAVFHIVFTLLNAFQGLFILLFGCLWDKKVQEALLHKFSLSRWSSQHTKSTSLASSTPVFSMSSPISRRFNNLFGKTGTYNVSPPETTISSTENSSSAYSLLN